MGLGLVGGILGINTGGVQNIVNNNTDQATAKMIRDKQAELAARMSETASRIEKEADEDAFIYLTRAGRDPKGCIRYLEVLSRSPQAEPNPAKPQIPGRIQAYRDFIDRESPEKYRKEGTSNLARYVKPLEFTVVAESGTLQIHSIGNRVKQNIDKF
jgi:predicted Zn-dependent protease